MGQFPRRNLGVMALALLAMGTVAVSPVRAAVGQLTAASQLTAGDEVFNPTGLTEGQVDSPLVITGTTNTVTLTAQNGTTGAFFYQPSDGSSVDPVAFPTGSPTLATSAGPFATASGPLQIDFTSGVQAFGLYAQDVASDTETFHISVISALTGVTNFNLAPVDNTSSTGTGVFLGAYSATAGDLINEVIVSSDSSQPGGSNDFIFGSVTAGSTVVPESSTLALVTLVGLGVLGGVWFARRRQQQTVIA